MIKTHNDTWWCTVLGFCSNIFLNVWPWIFHFVIFSNYMIIQSRVICSKNTHWRYPLSKCIIRLSLSLSPRLFTSIFVIILHQKIIIKVFHMMVWDINIVLRMHDEDRVNLISKICDTSIGTLFPRNHIHYQVISEVNSQQNLVSWY